MEIVWNGTKHFNRGYLGVEATSEQPAPLPVVKPPMPRNWLTATILVTLSREPMTSREVATRLDLDLPQVRSAICRLVRLGSLTVIGERIVRAPRGRQVNSIFAPVRME